MPVYCVYIIKARSRCRMLLNSIGTVDIELTYFENDDENATQK